MENNNPEKPSLKDLQSLVQKLRGPDGCPWDREQDFQDLKQYLLEECYEVLEAINSSSFEKLKEELGDLLFHIVFLAQMAQEKEAFELQDVLEGIEQKMIRRHPHVFGNVSVSDTEEVRRNWLKIKRNEKENSDSLLGSIPDHLPALQRAYRLSQRASRVGLDWPEPQSVLEKVKEEIRELEQALDRDQEDEVREEFGDLLFSIANLARHLKLNPEDRLQESNRKFLQRFQLMEKRALQEGRALETLSPEEMDRWWEQIKNADESSD